MIILGDEEPYVNGYEVIFRREKKGIFKEVLETLTDRERTVISERFGLIDGKEKTLDQVGERFGVCKERVRTIEKKAMRKLRHPTRSKKLEMHFMDLYK